MKKFLRKIFLGTTLPQEYLCLNLKDFISPLKLCIKDPKSQNIIDISTHHLFIGYKPLIIAIDKKYLVDGIVDSHQHLEISFQTEDAKELAFVELHLVNEVKINSTICLIFEGIKGVSSFLNSFHKIAGRIYYYFTSEKKQNIYLAGNLHEQIKIAYSIPRKIYLASVGIDDLFNIFPTDLSGKFGDEHFIISLRSGGKANKQIMELGKCLVSVMEPESFIEVYTAGKNHMKELTEITNIGQRIRDERSVQFGFPVPLRAIEYYELDKIDQFEFGIHVIHFFRIVNTVILSNEKSALAHLHRDYAEWRVKHYINTNYYLRIS